MKPLRIKTINEFHLLNQLPSPEYPLISMVDYAQVAATKKDNPTRSTVADYYSIAVKQFITRKITNHKILNRLEELLTVYFNSDDLANKGLPS